jgi:TolB protein
MAQSSLSLPMLDLPGAVHGLAWGQAGLPDPLPIAFAQAAALTPAPLWQPVEVPAIDLPPGRVQVVPLVGVDAPVAMLQDRVDESFYTLKEGAAKRAGWDFLTSLEQAYIPLTAPLNPGLMEDWLYTGRAFRFNTAPLNAGWLLVVRQDFGAQTYWRIYIRARFQDGTQGQPLKELPWNLSARLSGDPVAYERGGQLEPAVPPGYWVNFTDLAAAYGWERLPALSTWRASYPAARFNEFASMGTLDWESAMLELYPPETMITPSPVVPPTRTPTATLRWYVSPTPSPTPTPRPTFTLEPMMPTSTLPPPGG